MRNEIATVITSAMDRHVQVLQEAVMREAANAAVSRHGITRSEIASERSL
jgi:hypothetical protein